MNVLGEIHNKDLSVSMYEIYWRVLQPYEDEACIRVFSALIESSTYFPKPSDFCTRLADHGKHAALRQLSVVIKQLRETGSYGIPVFDDPITKTLMTSRWSWPMLCAMTETGIEWWSKSFVEAYEAYEHTADTCKMISADNKSVKALIAGIGGRETESKSLDKTRKDV